MYTKYDEKRKEYICYGDEPLIYVCEVKAGDDFSLCLTFTTGERKIFDARPLLEKKIYAPLKSKRLFGKAYASGGGVAWNDDLDIAPEYLYENSRSVG